VVEEREGVGGVDREGRRKERHQDEEWPRGTEWESKKILIKKICSVEQWITNVGYSLFTVKEKLLK
jgi:hypothetical protein